MRSAWNPLQPCKTLMAAASLLNTEPFARAGSPRMEASFADATVLRAVHGESTQASTAGTSMSALPKTRRAIKRTANQREVRFMRRCLACRAQMLPQSFLVACPAAPVDNLEIDGTSHESPSVFGGGGWAMSTR